MDLMVEMKIGLQKNKDIEHLEIKLAYDNTNTVDWIGGYVTSK